MLFFIIMNALPYWLGKDELFTYDITLELLVLNISSEVLGN